MKYEELHPYDLKGYSHNKLDILTYITVRKLFYEEYDNDFIILILHTLDLFIKNICLDPYDKYYDDLDIKGGQLLIRIINEIKDLQKKIKKDILNKNENNIKKNFNLYYKQWITLVKNIRIFMNNYE